MRKELRRSLFAAAIAGTALAGCGGGGGGGGGGSGSPPPPPPPPPPSAGSYFQAGRAGVNNTPTTLPFFSQAAPASPFGMVFWDPSVPANAFAVTTGAQNQLETGGVGLDLATVSEYFASGGMGTAWGIRYRVYADATNTAGPLYAVDLRKSGASPPNPAPVQLSSGTVSSMQLCPLSANSPATPANPAVFDDYGAAGSSWIVFHAKGPDLDCGTLDDQLVGIQLSMTSSMPPKALAQLEPVEAAYNASGAISSFLAINHPTVCTVMAGCSTSCNGTTVISPFGGPECPVPLQQLDASFNVMKSFTTTLTGNGSNLPSGDFRSLGISTGNVWLYVDSSDLYELDLASGTTTKITGFTAGTGDAVQGRAVFDPADASKAYVAFASNVAGASLGSTIVQIDIAAKTALAQARDAAGGGGITLVGVTSNNVVYVIDNGSAIKSVVKASMAGTTALMSPTGSQHIDPLMGPNGASGPPAAFLVGDAVYFTVADSSASGGTGLAKQAFTVNFNGSSTPGTATPLASTVSAVLGVVAPASIPTTGPYANAGALVLTGGANGATGQAVFAGASVGSALGLYGPNGALVGTTLGAFTMTNPGNNNNPRVNPVTAVALNGPVQAGMPATLEFFGPGGTGNDFAMFASDGSIPLTELSGFVQ